MYKKGQTGTFRYVTRESIYFVLSMEFSILFNETAYKSELYSWGKKMFNTKRPCMNSKHCKKITFNLYKPV